MLCTKCARGRYAAHVNSYECTLCAGDAFAATEGTATCALLAPGHVGDAFEDPGSMRGAAAQRPCPAGARVRSTFLGLNVVKLCERCDEGTVSSSPAATNCTSCASGLVASEDRTRCIERVEIIGGGGGDGGDGGGAVDDAIDRAGDEKYATFTSIAFFTLLALVALSCAGCVALYRRRKRRLRDLELEREMLLDEAEEEIATGQPVRRATLYALAGVEKDAEALRILGFGGGGSEGGSTPPRRKSSGVMSNGSSRGVSFADVGVAKKKRTSSGASAWSSRGVGSNRSSLRSPFAPAASVGSAGGGRKKSAAAAASARMNSARRASKYSYARVDDPAAAAAAAAAAERRP